ncbi:hypothetical protein HNR62_000580 [Oceanisphaera litoralis]|nr:hypothetical protein [Oceanisphaera litoralis]
MNNTNRINHLQTVILTNVRISLQKDTGSVMLNLIQYRYDSA